MVQVAVKVLRRNGNTEANAVYKVFSINQYTRIS